MRRLARTGLAGIVLSAALIAGLEAQSPPGTTVEGRVLGPDSAPLPRARIIRAGLRADTMVADRTGRYRVSGLPVGMHFLTFQHIGHAPVDMVVQAHGDTVLVVDVLLDRLPIVMDPLVARADAAGLLDRRLATVGFDERRRWQERTATDAAFITPEEIARRRPIRTSQLLEGRRGIHVEYLSNGFGAIARGRDGRCLMTVWLDGQMVFPSPGSLNRTGSAGVSGGLGAGGSGGLSLATRAGGDVAGVNMVDVNQIAAIEIYPSPSGTPPQFQSLTGTCGAVVMWSRQ